MDAFRLLIGPDEGASPAQLCFRALLLFILGIAYIRIAGRRTFSKATPLDIIVALIVGSNLSRIMTGKAPFWGALDATLVLVALHRLTAMSTVHWNWLARIVKYDPVVLVRDGAPDLQAMKRHGLGEEDLLEGLRLEQSEHPKDVKLAMLEGGGRISVIPKRRPGG
ncbi:MAG TPA: YetF domain-containing protein [Phenylobacterium sp.]|jgi:uncharacterized membrane protein YcaP (DUF421 family)|nr:YetF domain-containing protein [Phenylobacterium sp.]